METSAQLIVRLAKGYAGANLQEIQPNKGWTNKPYETDMRAIGWLPGDEWCAYSTILVWKKAYSLKPEIWAVVRRLISPNCQVMLKNFRKDPVWPTGAIPRLGAIAVWQSGNSLVNGHCGIVTEINGNRFTTAEGNTSSSTQPDIRTGWTYAEHVHSLNAPHTLTGLNFLRFIYAIEDYSPL